MKIENKTFDGKSQCNPCFDGDHKKCVDKRCECPCKKRITPNKKANKSQENKDWEIFDTWWDSHIKKINGGEERGIAYQDTKDFIRQQIEEAKKEEREKIFGGKTEIGARDSFEDYIRQEAIKEVGERLDKSSVIKYGPDGWEKVLKYLK